MNRPVIIKRTLIITGIIISISGLIAFDRLISDNNRTEIFTKVEKGVFEITVSNSGELLAEKSVDIMGPTVPQMNNPSRRRGIHISDLKILDIVPEGTIVNTGDYVAQIDRTTYDNTLKDYRENLIRLQENVDVKVLDTSVVLTGYRDAIKNQHMAVEEATLLYRQSKYESPSIIRQAEIRLDKETRRLEQLKRTYSLRERQQVRSLDWTIADLEWQKQLIGNLEEYISGFIITAPSPGMIIYKKNRNGSKRQSGSTISSYDNIVATLPDLSTLISKTYVSEIDISKIVTGQKVKISVDAFPDKEFTGEVISIAKIGEQLPNSDSKMFEVLSRLDGYDPDLRPSMTTGNEIVIETFPDASYVPLECVHAGKDEVPFVYTRNRTKQIVLLGNANEKYVIINEGLDPGTSIYLETPDNPDKFRVAGEEIITSSDQTREDLDSRSGTDTDSM